ncbi:MAG: NrfD/PsrC family molybdoenzyme membrane anchor subunit [Nitrososphaeria archaeon]
MNKKLLVWSVLFMIIGAALMLYGTRFTVPNTEPIPWGLLVMGYMLFGVIGTGISSYNSLYQLFNRGHSDKNPLGNIKLRMEWLALAVLIPGWIMVFASVYKPLTTIYLYISFNATSRIAWNGVLYTLVGLGIILEILSLIGEKVPQKNASTAIMSKTPTQISYDVVWGIIRFLLSIDTYILGFTILVELILDANLGSVFGYLSTWVMDFGPFTAILFVALSFYGGIAMISIVNTIYVHFNGKSSSGQEESMLLKTLSRDGLLSVLAVGFFEMWWIWIFSTNQETWPWTSLIMGGGFSSVFWGGVIIIGIVLSSALYYFAYRKKNWTVLMAAGILAIIGMFSIIFISDIIPQAITWYYSNSFVSPSASTWIFELRSQFNLASPWTLLPLVVDKYNALWFAGSALFMVGFLPLGIMLLPLEEREKIGHLWIFK